jgi:hypothetical protein
LKRPRFPNAAASRISSSSSAGIKARRPATYYTDEKNGMMVGYVSDTDEADYFGYVKNSF